MLISSNDYQKRCIYRSSYNFSVLPILFFFSSQRIPLFSHTVFSVCLCERVNPSGMSHSTVHKPNKAANYRPSKTPFFFIHSFILLLFLRPILFFNAHQDKKKRIFSNKEEELPYLKRKRLLEMHNSETDDGPVCF